MVTATQIYNALNENFSFATQESWDNSGLLIDSKAESDKVMCCLDVTHGAVQRAVDMGAKIIVSHHPVIFDPIKRIGKENVVYQLIENNISVISAHTNFDKYQYGTCYRLAQLVGLEIVSYEAEIGLLGKCLLQYPEQFAQHCKEVFGNVGFTDAEKPINKVFVCAGSGSGMKEEVKASGADAFLTGECKYHDMLDLRESGISVFTLGHDVSEKISVETLESVLANDFPDVYVFGYYEDDLVTHLVAEY